MNDTFPTKEHQYPHQRGEVTDDHLRSDVDEHPEAYDPLLQGYIRRYLERQSGELAIEQSEGDQVTARIVGAISEMQSDIAATIGADSLSPEAVAATDYVLLRETEEAVGSDVALQDGADLAVLVASASEAAGERVSQEENPIHALERDGYGAFIVQGIESLEQTDAHLPGSDTKVADVLVTELQKDRLAAVANPEHTGQLPEIFAQRVDAEMTARAREQLGVPEDMKRFAVIQDTKDIREADNEVNSLNYDINKGWQEQIFGNEAIADLRKDIVERFEVPNEQRTGQGLLDYHTGKERRPIMDIALDEHSRALVEKEIEKRSAGLDRALEIISHMAQAPENRRSGPHDAIPLSKYADALRELGVWGMPHGKLLDNDSEMNIHLNDLKNMAGTVADLYLNESDIEKYRQLDAIINEAVGLGIDSTQLLADGVINLAAHTFPSGVELMHALPEDSLEAVVRQGSISTRSQVMHGVQRTTELNGGFIHMTGPGTAAYEYAKNDATPTVVGVPIDTIVKYSPYMHLESSYIGNEFRRPGDQHASSMQYEMSSMQINDISTAPTAFRSAFEQMHENLSNGLRRTNIGQGKYNNFSFAASNERGTAGAYRYPLEEISLYSENFNKMKELIDESGDKRQMILDRSTVVVSGSPSGRPLGAAALPNFGETPGQPITVYAPMSAAEVAFTEETVGNSFDTSNIEYTFENIVPGTETKYMNQLIESGYAANEVVARAVDAVNTKGDHVARLFDSIRKNRQVLAESGVTISDIVERLSPDKIREIFIPFKDTLGDNEFHFNYPFTDSGFVRTFGDRLFAVDPEYFSANHEALESAGYQLTDAQAAEVREIEQRKAEEAARPIEMPSMDGFGF